MSNPDVNNVEHSGATLWVAPAGEAIPDETSVAYGAAWGGNWVKVGYTKAPWTQAYSSEEAEIEVEEELGAVVRRRIKEELVWETVLAEITAEYVRLAGSEQDAVTTTVAGAAQKAYEYTSLGGDAVMAVKKWGVEMLHLTSGGDEEPIRIFMHRGTAKFNGNLEFSAKSSEAAGIPIQIRALTDTSQNAGEKMCLFQRVTSETT
jgi:hypothetical protein